MPQLRILGRDTLRKPFGILQIAVLCIGLLSCTETREEQAAITGGQDAFEVTGTVAFVPLESGVFVILGDDGEVYDPINLDASYQVDCLRVRVVVSLEPDMVTFRMLGVMVVVLEIEVVGTCDQGGASFQFLGEENLTGFNEQEITDGFLRTPQ